MKKFVLLALSAALCMMLGTHISIAAEQAQQNTQAQKPAPVYGSQLMTSEERAAYRAAMRNLKTNEERAAFRAEHHQKMQERASAMGKTLPGKPPADAACAEMHAKMHAQMHGKIEGGMAGCPGMQGGMKHEGAASSAACGTGCCGGMHGGPGAHAGMQGGMAGCPGMQGGMKHEGTAPSAACSTGCCGGTHSGMQSGGAASSVAPAPESDAAHSGHNH